MNTPSPTPTAQGPTPTPWRRIAHGGSSTIVSSARPQRNDTRIPGYGYKDDAHCVAYPFIEDDGRYRLDFVCFSHADAEFIVLAVNSHARLTAENERLRAALVQARETFQSWTGPLRESAEYMQSQDVFPGTVHELRLAADFQQKAIAAIDSALTPPSGLADAPLLPQSAGTLGDRTL